MAVTNPQAVRFSNEQVRPVAEALARAYFLAKQVRDLWYATGMDVALAPGQGPIEDGSDVDGRTRIESDDAALVIARCQELIDGYEAGGGAKLNTVLKPAVNVR